MAPDGPSLDEEKAATQLREMAYKNPGKNVEVDGPITDLDATLTSDPQDPLNWPMGLKACLSIWLRLDVLTK